MSKINWERAQQDRKPKLSIKDEDEYRADDRASRWLAKVEASKKVISK